MRNIGRKISLLLLSAVAINAQCILRAGKVDLLSPEGLATPWELEGNCNEADPGTQSFIEATVYEPHKNRIFAYSPLVVTKGKKPLCNPVVPKISKQAKIVYHFGCNALTLTLADHDNGKTLKKAKCVNGLPGDVFGQFAYCNGPDFFRHAKRILHAGIIPPLGRAADGSRCPTTRDFSLIDQDQSDNVITTYLLLNNRTAQNTAQNRKKFPGATVVGNPSDNALLTTFVNPALKCKSFAIPALDDIGTSRPTLASDELMAALRQHRPIALVPTNDPMTLKGGKVFSIAKTNLYRAGTFQRRLRHNANAKRNARAYCRNYAKIAPPVILRQHPFTDKPKSSPSANMATTLFTFLGMRFNESWINLQCPQLTGKPSPIIAHFTNGIADSLTFHINGHTTGPLT